MSENLKGMMYMIQIRHGMFETNSSSTHTMVICPIQDYYDFADGKLLLWRGEEMLVRPEDMRKILAEDGYSEKFIDIMEKELEDKGYNDCFETFQGYIDDEWLEYFEDEFVTPSGDKMIAFGKYGRDG